MPHALLVEDDVRSLEALQEVVEAEGFTTSAATSLKQAREIMGSTAVDLLLTDLMLPDGSGMELAKEVQANPGSSTEVILITGHATVDSAVEALRMPVLDYLTKPVDVPRLKAILANVARTRELRSEISSLRGELRKLGHFGPMLGASTSMQRVYDMVTRVATTEATVLLTGETGTGKDLTASTLHQLSRRRQNSFLAINCGAVSPNLIESELFGHERGSFTGADRMHRGYFERAHQGTLFLDEVAEMPLELQVKLLRVLETGTITRIGGEKTIPVDVRIIAATNRRPEDAVSDGKLREDLFYRLKVFPVLLPPLRDRGDDLELLANHFLEVLNQAEGENKRFTREAIERMRAHSWPGNVRELKNVVHGAFILADDEIGGGCLPPEITGEPVAAGPTLEIKVGTTVAEAERRLLLATLHEQQGDKKRTAEILGVSLKTLYNRLHAYKVQGGAGGLASTVDSGAGSQEIGEGDELEGGDGADPEPASAAPEPA
jgi:two-component system, NtrC family, response regulator AtoC